MSEDVLMERLEVQIDWCENRATRKQRSFRRLRYLEISAAAGVVVLAGVGGVPRWVLAVLGSVVLIAVAVIHFGRPQEEWHACRSRAEKLKLEKWCYLERIGPYAGVSEPRSLLRERLEELVHEDTERWISQSSTGS
jgi:uncharacterized protein DUF4231